jgi:2',3'-cyclic-nucleotide 2'-phosphodiesterase
MIGDVIGRPGRKILKQLLPTIKRKLNIHFVCANGENVAGGFGITHKTFQELIDNGVDFVSMGNHWKDKPDIHQLVKTNSKIMLPLNLEKQPLSAAPWPEIEVYNGLYTRKICVLNLMGIFAMKDEYGSPFEYLEKNLSKLKAAKESGQYIFVCDIHAEANSEKQAIFWFLDGLASLVVGTHTHTPTSDERISRQGTALLTDLGMTGGYQSIIGMSIEGSQRRYFSPVKKQAQEVAEKEPWFCGFLAEIDATTGACLNAHRIQIRLDGPETSSYRFCSVK